MQAPGRLLRRSAQPLCCKYLLLNKSGRDLSVFGCHVSLIILLSSSRCFKKLRPHVDSAQFCQTAAQL